MQKKNSQLEWENEVLREKTQELEVAKQVLQAEVEKAREVRHRSRTFNLKTSQKMIFAYCYFTWMFELHGAER